MSKLTPEIIQAKTGMAKLDEIKSLNCSCYGLQDISILAELKNVEVLSLSLNKIISLRDFSRCFKLKELYLRKNEVSSLSDIDYLRGLPELTTLWLSENPVADTQGYRMSVIQRLPRLTKLDNEAVTDEEKARAVSAGNLSAGAGPRGSESEGPGAVTPSPKERGVSGPGAAAAARATPARISGPVSPLPRGSTPQPSAPSPRGQAASAGAAERRCSPNVLYAVMALLRDLDDEGLRIIRAEADQRLAGLGGDGVASPRP